MTTKHVSNKTSKKQELSEFLGKANQLPQRLVDSVNSNGRIIFALDATASRQASWDRACQLQSEMFSATDTMGGIQLQLCYYRGFNEFNFSPWLQDSNALRHFMHGVQCQGGHTQLEQVLNHSLREHADKAIQALIIITDAVEEDVDRLCNKAGQMGIMKIPIFIFQEGFDPTAQRCFKQLAKISNGAYANFNDQSAKQLADLLAAVATYAAGGHSALQKLNSSSAKQLLQQLRP